jgi:hypothetical protein
MLPCRDWADEFADEMAFSRSSVLPKPFEPIRSQRRVAHRRGDGAVAQIMLDRSDVLAVIGQLVAAAMTEHVTVDEEPEPTECAVLLFTRGFSRRE